MKLYKSILLKMRKGLTKKQVATLLFLEQVKDDFGMIVNVHWKEIAKQADMVAQSFYNSIRGLESAGFIKVTKSDASGNANNFGYHTIQMLVPTAHKLEDITNGTVPEIIAGKASLEELNNYWKSAGQYLNLKEYSLVNTEAFRKLTVNAQLIVLDLLLSHSNSMNSGTYAPWHISLSLAKAAKDLGFVWEHGKKGEVVRRKMKRYYTAIIESGLLPLEMDENFTIHWDMDNQGLFLPEQHLYADIEGSERDSIAETCNRRVINTVLEQEKAEADADDVKDTLQVLEQFKKMSGLKILSTGVKNIIKDCIIQCQTIVPSYINVKVREFLGLIKSPSPA